MQPIITFIKSLPNTAVAITGHMIDRENRALPRFPSSNVIFVRQELTRHLNQLAQKYGLIDLIVCATKGVDLLAIEWGVQTNNAVNIFLPQDESSFLKEAVNYGDDGTKWLDLYATAKKSPKVKVYTPVLIENPEVPFESPSSLLSQHYVDLNNYMIRLLRPQDFLIAYWDGRGGDAPGGTKHMFLAAANSCVQSAILNIGLENVDPRYDSNKLCYLF